MSQFDEESDYSMKLAQELQQDLPTIYTSAKNLIAYMLGKNSSGDDQVPVGHVMACAKFLLQAIQTSELPDLEQFCSEHPQPEKQLGMERLDDICKYKAVYALRSVAVSKGGKVSRLFGRQYFVWSKQWTSIRVAATTLIEQNTDVLPDDVQSFLDTYENSLNLEGGLETPLNSINECVRTINNICINACFISQRCY